jgi:hypothetical protein
MPNKYEREIEEILRNLETTEPKPGLRLGERLRRKPDYRVKPRRRGFPSLNFRMSEWLIIIAVIAALISGGYAYAVNEPNVVTGVFAIVGAVCLVLALLSPFIFRSNRSPYARRSAQSPNYGNVTPLRRNPLSNLATRWNLFLLKIRYRRKNGR